MKKLDTKTFLEDHPNLSSVELVLTDPSGVARGKWAPISVLDKAFEEGVTFPLSLHGLDVWGNEVAETGLHIESGDLDGFNHGVEGTLVAVPWPHNCSCEHEATTAQVILQTRTAEDGPFMGCARTVLEHQVQKLAAKGRFAVCAFELEFHLLEIRSEQEASGKPSVVEMVPPGEAQFMYGLDALAQRYPVFSMIRKAALWSGLPVDTVVKEAGPNQFEVNLTHRDDALRAADDVVLLKRIVTEAARVHGLRATFMAKPFIDQPGNGMHVHASLLDQKGSNVFADPETGEAALTSAAAGLVATMDDMALVFINTRNGFRRMAEGSYAPVFANWGENNRSVAVRLPAAPPKARRLEHRVSGADANPYLVLAAILAGIDAGLDKTLSPPPPLVGNAYDPATPNRGIRLPSSMGEALSRFEASAFAREALGETMAANLLAIKKAELKRFEQDISDFEMQTYL